MSIYPISMAWVQLQQRIATDRVEMPIIFITGHSDVPISVKAMKAGAIEFVIKPFDVDTRYWTSSPKRSSAAKVALAAETESRVASRRYDALSTRRLRGRGSDRCRQVTGQAGQPETFRISEITVKAHRGRVMRKIPEELNPLQIS